MNGNYLRVRGEYAIRTTSTSHLPELPPRARRIRRSSLGAVAVFGTTSACAENTVQNQFNKPHARNYLRVRGEYIMRKIDAALISELPPRARRIQQMLYAKAVMEGTTSACAENTVPRLRCRRWCGNYLRVRGEYTGDNEGTHYIEELPPRARRIHTIRLPRPMLFGTTSACAENTLLSTFLCACFGNYLRVRGEYYQQTFLIDPSTELPPRARRIQH